MLFTLFLFHFLTTRFALRYQLHLSSRSFWHRMIFKLKACSLVCAGALSWGILDLIAAEAGNYFQASNLTPDFSHTLSCMSESFSQDESHHHLLYWLGNPRRLSIDTWANFCLDNQWARFCASNDMPVRRSNKLSKLLVLRNESIPEATLYKSDMCTHNHTWLKGHNASDLESVWDSLCTL